MSQVAETILAQLGGNRFKVMTGACSFSSGKDCLTFRLKTNPKRINAVRITLTPLDLYKMEFIKIKKFEVVVDKEVDGVYCDQLQEVFTNHTGLYTHL